VTQADYDRASRDYYDEQLSIAASLMQRVIRWFRTLNPRALHADADMLWEVYRDMVSEARGRSYEAGTRFHSQARNAAGLPDIGTFLGRNETTEARQAAASYFVHTAPVTREIQRGRLDDPEFLAEIDDIMSRAGTNLARDAGRLAEQGGRDALADARENDPEVIGYYRKTDPDPCGFCAMLASRGLVYTEDRNASRRTRSWVDEQNPDQYHPDCHCQTLPLFRGQSMPADDRRRADEYARMWNDTEGSGETQLKNFRDRIDAQRRERNG
jgi:hypothetical protein